MWKIAESTIKPETLQIIEDEKLVYIRKDIHQITRQHDEQEYTLYQYYENCMPLEDWKIYEDIYLNSLDIVKNRANIDYVAMMTDVEIPEV